ncbi:hypothetical protein Poli38472_009089 [Pythium oligandrum]|uniref:Uncharacterized protein n=1 Tax=Pythium oligandrum TaxID=41045 RepID=A0A8K1FMJ1_PYTOL|nr:hypothetical protein Poli38472_009089 [Pythium oligandrum]|eukprot:TMW64922.1 hypothetical protein Poli38472_009089 [Pythium oligandrum]
MHDVPSTNPAEWETCVFQMRQLRAAVEQVRYTTEDRDMEHLLLKHIALTRTRIDRILLARPANADGSRILQLRVLVERSKRILDSIIQNKGIMLPTISALREKRKRDITLEIDAVESLVKGSTAVSYTARRIRHDRVVVPRDDAQNLSGLIQHLRALEFSMGFREGLASALVMHQGQEEYSDDNYAYGSTPFDTWVKICSLPVLREAAQKHEDAQNPLLMGQACDDICRIRAPWVVLGSSTGSLVMFCAMLFQIPCVGVEILPFLHQIAVELQEKHSIPNCSFINADMLKVALNSPSIVILTSQCWDEDLYAQIQRKLARELHPGALVVDYRNGFLESPDFTLVSRVEGLRVSWTNTQTVFVYQRQDNPQT